MTTPSLMRAVSLAAAMLTTPALALPSRETPLWNQPACTPPTMLPGAFSRPVPLVGTLLDNEGNEIGMMVSVQPQIFALSRIDIDYVDQRICFRFQSALEGVTVAPAGPVCFDARAGAVAGKGEDAFTATATFPGAEPGPGGKARAPLEVPLLTMTPERARGIYLSALHSCPRIES